MVRSWTWLSFVIYFIVIGAGNEVQEKEKEIEFSPEFMEFVKDLDSNIFHSNRRKHLSGINFIRATTTKIPTTRKLPHDDGKLKANQTAAIRDILMLKLVSYYEDKYKIGGTKDFTTPSMLEPVSERSRLDTASSYHMGGRIYTNDFKEQTARFDEPRPKSFLVAYPHRNDPGTKSLPQSYLRLDEPTKKYLLDFLTRVDQPKRETTPDSRLDEPRRKYVLDGHSEVDETGRNNYQDSRLDKPSKKSSMDYYTGLDEPGRKTLSDPYSRLDEPGRKSELDPYSGMDEIGRNNFPDFYPRLDEPKINNVPESYSRLNEPMRNNLSDSRLDEPKYLVDYYSDQDELRIKSLPVYYAHRDERKRKTLLDARVDENRKRAQEELYSRLDEPKASRRSLLDSFSEEELKAYARNAEQSQEVGDEIVVM